MNDELGDGLGDGLGDDPAGALGEPPSDLAAGESPEHDHGPTLAHLFPPDAEPPAVEVAGDTPVGQDAAAEDLTGADIAAADHSAAGEASVADGWQATGFGEAAFASVCAAVSATGFAARDLSLALDRLGVPALDRVAGLGGHLCSIALSELGAEALVEHSDIDDLAMRVTLGEDIVLSIGDRAVSIVSCDVAAGTVVLGGPAATTARLADFERAWAATAYEVVVTLGGGRQTCVLPLDASWADLSKQMAELGDSPPRL